MVLEGLSWFWKGSPEPAADGRTGDRTKVEDVDLGYRFYAPPKLPFMEHYLEKFTGFRVDQCGRKGNMRCYYVEGVEGDPRFERAMELAGDLAERFQVIDRRKLSTDEDPIFTGGGPLFGASRGRKLRIWCYSASKILYELHSCFSKHQDIRAFAKPAPRSLWRERERELRLGLPAAINHDDSVLVYEGCAASTKQHRDIPPCYTYVGDLEMFTDYIRDTHQVEWNRRRLKSFGSQFGAKKREKEPEVDYTD